MQTPNRAWNTRHGIPGMKHLATAITTAILAIATIALANDYEILNTDTDELETENCYEEIEPRTINIERDKAVQRFLEEERKALGKNRLLLMPVSMNY